MAKSRTYQWLNFLGLAFVLTMNTLANTLPINGQTTGEVSAKYENLFVPAGYTFSIWGLIYLLLLIFAIAQARGLFGQRPAPAATDRIGIWFFLSCLANGLWILAWHYERLELSLAIMLFLLFSLIVIYRRLSREGVISSASEKWTFALPFSVYLGWISIATIANTAALLTGAAWDGGFLSPSVWTAVVLLTGTLLGMWFLLRWQDVAYALVIIWAFAGILVRRSQLDDTTNLIIIVPLALGLGILSFLSLRQLARR